MGKTKCIRVWKDRIMSELSNDDTIIKALGLNPDEDPDDLVWKRYFPHYFIPDTQNTVKSYILVEIDIPERRNRYDSSNGSIFIYPTIIFCVLTHQDDMKMDIAGESGTRMDYIAELLDDKYEGRLDFGAGVLQLQSDISGSVNDTYRFRQLKYEAVDVNGVCG